MTECFRNAFAAGVVSTFAFLGLFTLLQAFLNYRAHQARERRRMQHELDTQGEE